jgi:hypothetical protein
MNGKKEAMSDHVYKKVELVGSSETSVEAAIQNAIEAASKTLKHLEWFEVMETRGHIVDGKVGHYQVVLKVGLRIEG